MRCKPGQMAYIKSSSFGNEGLVITCVKLVHGTMWIVDPPLMVKKERKDYPILRIGDPLLGIVDECLIPISDPDCDTFEEGNSITLDKVLDTVL